VASIPELERHFQQSSWLAQELLQETIEFHNADEPIVFYKKFDHSSGGQE
jgi:hypothetical protein